MLRTRGCESGGRRARAAKLMQAIVEHGMRNKGSRRSPLRELFAERRIHVRSADQSRYVVLSPALQIGVALGGLAIAILLGLTTYNALSGRLALNDQQRALAELSAQVQDAEDARDRSAALQRRNEEAEQEIARLSAALADAQDDRDAADSMTALQDELGQIRTQNEELTAALEQARTARAAEAEARSREIEVLRAEVTGLRAEIDRLEREAQSLRRAAGQAQPSPDLQQIAEINPAPPSDAPPDDGETAPLRIAIAAGPAAQEVRRIQQDLAGAQAAIAQLGADLDAAKSPRPGAGPPRPLIVTEADLANLEERLNAANQRAQQLGVHLAAQADDQPAADSQVVAAPPPLPPPPAPR